MATPKKRRVVRLTVSADTPLDAISLVDMPAIEENFRLFGIEQLYVFARMDQEKRVVSGPAMIPDKLIPRVNQKTGEIYDVYFTADDVEKTSQMFMQYQKQSSVNIQHEEFTKGVTVVESWIVTDPASDKSTAMGYELPAGTWMVSMKVEDPGVWELVKSGVVRGFSIEGFFAQKAIEAAKITEDIMNKQEFAAAKLADGTPVFSKTDFAPGAEVFSDEAMTTPLADGDYTLEDGTAFTVASGKVADAPAADTTAAAAPAPADTTAPAADATPAAATDGPSADQVLAMIQDLSARVQALEEAATKSAEAVQNSETKLATAMAKIEELSKAPGGKSTTEKFSDKDENKMSPMDRIREMAKANGR